MISKIKWPQITWLILWAVEFGYTAAKQGEPVVRNYSISATAFNFLFTITILLWGDFFD